MERREKVSNLKGGVVVGKSGGPSTPPPTWRLEFPSHIAGATNKNQVQEFLNFPTSTTTLSARKLCAKLWQVQPHQLALLPKMSKPPLTRRDTLSPKHSTQPSQSPPHRVSQ